MQQFTPKYQDRIAFVPVSLDRSIEEAKAYIDNSSLGMKAYGDLKGSLLKKLDIQYVPTTLMVDASGNLLKKRVGSMTDKEIENLLNSALK